ncbi:MAG: tetratricopeptide repeat protein [Leadbetterella sp.]
MRLAIFLILLTRVAICQDLHESIRLANDYFEAGRYESASKIFDRVAFFDTSGITLKQIYPKLALVAFKTEKYEQAIEYYNNSYQLADSDSVKVEFSLQKIACNLLLQQLPFAEIDILELEDRNLDSAQKSKLIAYKGILHFGKGDYNASEFFFKSVTKDSTLLHELFRKNKKIDKLKPKTARILSMVFPGLGQMYAGDYKNGINSTLLTSTILFLGIRGAILNNPLDASISALPWFQRYYQGGYSKAYSIAAAKIQQRRYKVFAEILQTL